jgi:hypothetical protein
MDSYLEHGSVKSAWMTIFILTIIWGVLYAVRPLFTKPNEISDPETADKRPTTNSMLVSVEYTIGFFT